MTKCRFSIRRDYSNVCVEHGYTDVALCSKASTALKSSVVKEIKRRQRTEATAAAWEELMRVVYGALVECTALLLPGHSTALSRQEVRKMALEAIKQRESFSGPAGYALTDEVAKLRAVARAAEVFSKLNIEHLRDWPDDRELWDCGGTMLRVGHVRQLRDALANIPKETP